MKKIILLLVISCSLSAQNVDSTMEFLTEKKMCYYHQSYKPLWFLKIFPKSLAQLAEKTKVSHSQTSILIDFENKKVFIRHIFIGTKITFQTNFVENSFEILPNGTLKFSYYLIQAPEFNVKNNVILSTAFVNLKRNKYRVVTHGYSRKKKRFTRYLKSDLISLKVNGKETME